MIECIRKTSFWLASGVAALLTSGMLQAEPENTKRDPKPGSEFLWLAEPAKTHTDAQTGMELPMIQAGSFMMGCDPGTDQCADEERPQHKVTLPAFYLGKTEVTQAQWKKVMGSNPSKHVGDDLPVENVKWDEARTFCEKIGGRLPTEAEWEYAARAGTTSKYLCGNDSSCLNAAAWIAPNAGEQTNTVGKKQANAWGLYDMAGNVEEWVGDWYSESYYSSSPTDNPKGPSSGFFRVKRGGSFYFSLYFTYMRVAHREKEQPEYGHGHVGFRCARSL